MGNDYPCLSDVGKQGGHMLRGIADPMKLYSEAAAKVGVDVDSKVSERMREALRVLEIICADEREDLADHLPWLERGTYLRVG